MAFKYTKDTFLAAVREKYPDYAAPEWDDDRLFTGLTNSYPQYVPDIDPSTFPQPVQAAPEEPTQGLLPRLFDAAADLGDRETAFLKGLRLDAAIPHTPTATELQPTPPITEPFRVPDGVAQPVAGQAPGLPVQAPGLSLPEILSGAVRQQTNIPEIFQPAAEPVAPVVDRGFPEERIVATPKLQERSIFGAAVDKGALTQLKETFGTPEGRRRFVPVLNMLDSAPELFDVLTASQRVRAEEYGDDAKGQGQREKDVNTLLDFEQKRTKEAGTVTSLGYDILEVASHIPAFVIQFAITGGAFEAGKAVAKKGATKALGGLAKKRAGALTVKAVGAIGGTLARTANPIFSGQITARALEEMIPDYSFAEGEAGELELLINEEGKGAAHAALIGFADMFIENLSEIAGPQLGKVYRAMPGAKRVRMLKAALVKRHLSIGGRATLRTLKKKLAKVGWHGMAEEWGEERVGDVLRTGTALQGVEPTIAGFTDPRQIATELGAFALPGLGGAAIAGAAGGRRGKAPTQQEALDELVRLAFEEGRKTAADLEDVATGAEPTAVPIGPGPPSQAAKPPEPLTGAAVAPAGVTDSGAEYAETGETNKRGAQKRRYRTTGRPDGATGNEVGQRYDDGMDLGVTAFEDDTGDTAPNNDGTDEEYIKEIVRPAEKGGKPASIIVGVRKAPGAAATADADDAVPGAAPIRENRAAQIKKEADAAAIAKADEARRTAEPKPAVAPIGSTVAGDDAEAKPGAAVPPAGEAGPHATLVQQFDERLSKPGKINNPELTQMADAAFGGTRGEGAYDPRDSADAMEAGVNQHIERSGIVDFDDPSATVDRLIELTDRLPRQVDRTEEQIEFQQFSTVPAEGFVLVNAAGIRPGMTVLEPSAGTGNLATLAKLAGGEVVTNEISERRRSLLEGLGFETHGVDAQHLNSLLPKGVRPDVVVMNPPFSATGGKVKAHNTKFGAKHVTEALARLKPGGRLVAIVGQGMAHDRVGFSKWWEKIEGKFNVRANVGISGKHYGKFGTGFDNNMLVIDKTGPTPGATRAERIGNIIRASDLGPTEALELLGPLGKERIDERIQQGQDAGDGAGEGARADGPAVQRGTVREPVAATGDTGDGGRGRPAGGEGRAGRPGRERVRPVDGADAAAGEPRTGDTGGATGVRAGERGAAEDGEGAADVGGERADAGTGRAGDRVGRVVEFEAPTDTTAAVEEEGGVFSEYQVQKAAVQGAVKHPADIVESTTMASVEPPDVTYTPQIPQEVITEGRLSDVQLEAITYAGQAHENRLPDGRRGAFWIGDGTGVGKGREIAGIMLDNYERGNKRAVWVSIAHQLRADAERDLEAVGVPLEVLNQQAYKLGDAIPDQDGVVFTTYSMLRQGWNKDRERFKQLEEWMGKDFSGVVVYDESHSMKNAFGGAFGGDAKEAAGTQTGAMGIEMQSDQLWPDARFVYVSATAATEGRHLGYMQRLGLWGEGSPFSGFIDFLSAMKQGGVGAMEMLARDLKAVGRYVSRSISYEGVEYAEVEHTLTLEEENQYNLIADFWLELLNAFESGAENAGQGKKGSSGAFSQFYGTQQRFFLQLMMSYQLPDVLAAADKDLADGKSVVISLYNTNEGATKKKVADAIAQGINLDELDFTPKEALVDLINRHFPTQEFEQVTDAATGKTQSVPVTDGAGNPVLNAENVEKQAEMLEQLADINVPANPFDEIVNHFGPNKVAEISGRKKRIEGDKFVNRKIKGVPNRRLNEHETAAFQNGSKRVAVISGAASTGISLHADKRAKNKQRRAFYAMQLSWSADKQMQAFGRVHRSFQASAPEIKLAKTNLKGQERLANAVSQRLASLGALSKGGRETLGGSLFAVEDITDEYGQAALAGTYQAIRRGDIEGVKTGQNVLEAMGVTDGTGNVKENAQGNVNTFLNRILAMRVDVQNAVFEDFFGRREALVDQAKEHGLFDLGVETIKADDIRLKGEPQTVFTHSSGAETKLVELEGDFDVQRVTWDAAQRQADSLAKSFRGYYENKRSGKTYLVYKPSATRVVLVNPKSNKQSITSEFGDPMRELDEKHTKLSETEAKKRWNAELVDIPTREARPITVLTGAVFPIYDKIVDLTGGKVVRVQTEKGQSFVGLRVQQKDVAGLKQRLGVGVELAKAPSGEIFDLVMDARAIVELDNKWRLRVGRVHGEDRFEVDVRGQVGKGDELKLDGAFEEVIDFKRRYFIPSTKKAALPILDTILEKHKAISDLTAKRGGTSTAASAGGGEGPLGERRPAVDLIDDNETVRFPLELPEAVRLHKEMLGGRAPKVVKHLRSLKGTAVGQFVSTSQEGQASVVASLFERVPAAVRDQLRQEAVAVANVENEQDPKTARTAEVIYKELLEAEREKHDEPADALRVLLHEIGHAADWAPDKSLKKGSILGSVASIGEYTKSMIGATPEAQEMLLEPRDRKRIRQAAERAVPGKRGRKDKAAVSAKYQEMIENERLARGLVTRGEIMDELRDLGQWWKPFDRELDPAFTKYRESPRELYADAVSVLFNNPVALQQRAPAFYRSFFAWFKKKPDVQRIYNQLQDDIRTGAYRNKTRKDVREGFVNHENEQRRTLTDAADMGRMLVDGLQVGLWDINQLTYDYVRKSKTGVDDAANPVYGVEESLHVGSEHELLAKDINQRVLKVLSKGKTLSNNPWDDFGEYVMYQRVLYGDRKDLGNPWGIDVKRAREILENEMPEQYGKEGMAVLEEARKAFWEIRKGKVVAMMQELGMYSRDLAEKAADNEFYVTFDVTEFLEAKFGGGMSGHIYRQVGTLKDIGNPATATIMKDMSLITAMRRNVSKLDIVDFLRKSDDFHTEINPAKVLWNGKFQEPIASKDKRRGLIVVMRNGKIEGWDVPVMLATAYNNENVEAIRILGSALRFLGAPMFRKLFIELNPGFWMTNMVRDFVKMYRGLPGASVAGTMVAWTKGVKPAIRSIWGTPSEVERDLFEAGALIGKSNPRGLTGDVRAVERELGRYGISQTFLSEREKKFGPLRQFYKGMSWLTRNWAGIGQVVERIPKFGGWMYLSEHRPDISERRRAHIVRWQAGSPDFLMKSMMSPVTNNVWIFSDAMKAGWRAEFELYKLSPIEWWWKMMVSTGMYTIFTWAAKEGLVGAGMFAVRMIGGAPDDEKYKDVTLQELYGAISEYDLLNYNCYPVALTKSGKVVFLRVPMDEEARVFHGIMTAILNNDLSEVSQNVLDYMGGQTPNLVPSVKLAWMWRDFGAGRDSWDEFRGRPVLDETVSTARDSRALKELGKRTWNDVGLGVIHRFNTDSLSDVKTQLEENLALPFVNNVAGRWLKISNRGVREGIQEVKQEVRKEKARVTLDARELTRKFAGADAFSVVEGAGKIAAGELEALTPRELTAIAKKYKYINNALKSAMSGRMGGVWVQELETAQGPTERTAILKLAVKQARARRLEKAAGPHIGRLDKK